MLGLIVEPEGNISNYVLFGINCIILESIEYWRQAPLWLLNEMIRPLL